MPSLFQPQDAKVAAALGGRNQGINLRGEVCITQQSVWCQKKAPLQEAVNLQTCITINRHEESQVWIKHRICLS